MNKPTSALLPNLRPMAVNDRGQNYTVNGYLEFQMECLGESKDYDYWFFAGVSGDAHTQVFTADTSKLCSYLSQIDFSPEVAKKWYDAVGYDFTMVTEQQFNADRPRYVGELMEFIDRGIPVIAKHTTGDDAFDEFWLLLGYEDSGRQLVFVTDNEPGAETKHRRVPTNQQVHYVFILPGAKKKAPSLAEVYRQAVLDIPTLLTRPKQDEVSFGRGAFEAWADHLLAEDYAGWTDEQLDFWKLHTSYVCILATNGHCRAFLDRAIKLCPDLPFLSDVSREYAEQYRREGSEGLAGQLQAVGGSFNITKETLRNKEAKQPIADVLRRYVDLSDRIVEIYRKNGYGPVQTARGGINDHE